MSVALVREVACSGSRVFGLRGVTVEQARILLGALEACPRWQEHPGIGELRAFRSAAGHQVLLVPSTGRVQIRVAYTVPPTERFDAAAGVFVELARLGRARRSSSR